LLFYFLPNDKRLAPALFFLCCIKFQIMKQIPEYLPAGFIIITFVSIFFFYYAACKNRVVLIILLAWLLLQTILGLSGFFLLTSTLPPRLFLLIMPPLLAVVAIFSTAKGRAFTDGLDMRMLTLLHTVRIAVEIILFGLFVYKAMPQLMTFEGRNFDILSGLTAPLVYYWVFVKKRLGTKTLLAWNCICLAILFFTVSNAILSVPGPFQRFGIDQPTVAVLYFPFVWLPGMVVPIVYFSHLVSIRRLLKELRTSACSALATAG
jgi:hypothetical protein